MNKSLYALLCCFALFPICFVGCATQEKGIAEVALEEDATMVNELKNTIQVERQISRELMDNFYVDAKLMNCEKEECESIEITPIFNSPQEVASVLFPHDDSKATVEQIDNESNSYTISTETGSFACVYEGALLYYSNNAERALYQEVLNLMSRWANDNPNQGEKISTILSADDAIDYGKNVVLGLGISFEPVVETIVAMDYAQLITLQKECMTHPEYAEFGVPYILPKDSDILGFYYISFTLSHNGIPVFGNADESDVIVANGMFPPIKSRVEMIIASDGIKYLSIIEGYNAKKESEKKPIISIENAINLLKNKYEMVVLTEKNRVSQIWLEYIPISTETGLVMNPYWCFSIDMQAQNMDTGELFWLANRKAERFNAFTGMDITYGG